jgi:hypothetical protein
MSWRLGSRLVHTSSCPSNSCPSNSKRSGIEGVGDTHVISRCLVSPPEAMLEPRQPAAVRHFAFGFDQLPGPASMMQPPQTSRQSRWVGLNVQLLRLRDNSSILKSKTLWHSSASRVVWWEHKDNMGRHHPPLAIGCRPCRPWSNAPPSKLRKRTRLGMYSILPPPLR